jgi:hypothetical protein
MHFDNIKTYNAFAGCNKEPQKIKLKTVVIIE